MKINAFIILLTIFTISSCNHEYQSKPNHNDKQRYMNYVKAIQNGSTFQNFVVISVKNLNNGEIREYCTKGNFLLGALHIEYNLDYSKEELLKVYNIAFENTKRYFEFKNDSALWNISGHDKYTMKELSDYENKIKIDSLVYRIQNGKKWGITIKNDKEMKMCAHALFNKGILTGENSCFGGSLVLDDSE